MTEKPPAPSGQFLCIDRCLWQDRDDADPPRPKWLGRCGRCDPEGRPKTTELPHRRVAQERT